MYGAGRSWDGEVDVWLCFDTRAYSTLGQVSIRLDICSSVRSKCHSSSPDVVQNKRKEKNVKSDSDLHRPLSLAFILCASNK